MFERRVLVALSRALGLPTSCAPQEVARSEQGPPPAQFVSILEAARTNDAYRRVLATGARMQVVVMSIPPGGNIGEESHTRVEQILVCTRGRGESVVDGVRRPFSPGDMVMVGPGSRHDFENTGDEPLQICTIYAPPNHLPGRVQATKADAERDEEDNAFGRRVEAGRDRCEDAAP